MKIFHTTCATILSILILGSVMQKDTSVHAEEKENPGTAILQPTSGFKQLSNEELWRDYFAIVLIEQKNLGQELTQEEIEKIKQRYIESSQSFYDFYLKMLLWNHYRQSENWDNLDMSGLKKLQWLPETNKSSYKTGEAIGFQLSLKNISEQEATVLYPALSTGFILNSIELKRSRLLGKEKTKAYLTEHGNTCYPNVGFHGNPRAFRSFGLQPGEIAPTNQSIKVLNRFYDLSEPGEYELTFYTRNYLDGDENQIGEYPKPCTIRFTIEKETYEPAIEQEDVQSDGDK